MAEDRRKGMHQTFQGYATPEVGEVPGGDRSSERPSRHGGTPMVEVEVVHEHGPAPRLQYPFRVLEVWTRNRIYVMDPTMICVEVTDRASGQADPRHGLLGHRLVGGQFRDGEVAEISCPYPRPGSEAVFEPAEGSQANYSRTSTVTRVVLRLHVVTVAPSHEVPTWDEIRTSLAPPPGDAD